MKWEEFTFAVTVVSPILKLASEDNPLVFIEFYYETIWVIIFELTDKVYVVEVGGVCRVKHLGVYFRFIAEG